MRINPAEPINAYDGFSVVYEASDTLGITKVGLRVSGPFSQSNETLFPTTPTVARGTLQAFPPRPMPFGIPVKAELTVTNTRGGTVVRSLEFVAYERQVPSVSLDAPAVLVDTSVNVGDELRLTVTGTDDDQLAWVGIQELERSDSRDSVALGGRSGTVVFQRNVTNQWLLVRPWLVAWARDRSGNAAVTDRKQIRLFHFEQRSAVTRPLPLPVSDMVYDGKRNRIYLSLPGDAADTGIGASIKVFDPASRTFLPDLLSGVRATGMDLTLTGDSLIVALPSRRSAGVFDLTRSSATMTEIPASAGGATGSSPDRLRIDRSGRVLMTVLPDGGGDIRLAVLDLRTRIVSPVGTDSPLAEQNTPGAAIVRSADRGRLYVLSPRSSGARGYIWQDGALSSGVSLDPASASQVSISEDGSALTFGRAILDDALRPVRTLTAPDFAGYYWQPTVMARSGTSVFFGTAYGFVRIRSADGALMEQVKLPASPRSCITAPADALLVCGAWTLVGSTALDVLLLVELN